MSSVKSIRFNRESGQVDCFDGTTKLCSVDGATLNIKSDNDIVNFIKEQGSIERAISQIKTLSQHQ
jgi:hypothetical protein